MPRTSEPEVPSILSRIPAWHLVLFTGREPPLGPANSPQGSLVTPPVGRSCEPFLPTLDAQGGIRGVGVGVSQEEPGRFVVMSPTVRHTGIRCGTPPRPFPPHPGSSSDSGEPAVGKWGAWSQGVSQTPLAASAKKHTPGMGLWVTRWDISENKPYWRARRGLTGTDSRVVGGDRRTVC